MKEQKPKSEARIQREIIEALKDSGWLVTKLQSASTNGWPDLIAIKGGKVVFIEVKRPEGNLSPVQVIRHKMLKAKGAEVYVMYNALEVQLMEEELGVC